MAAVTCFRHRLTKSPWVFVSHSLLAWQAPLSLTHLHTTLTLLFPACSLGSATSRPLSKDSGDREPALILALLPNKCVILDNLLNMSELQFSQ